jgi:hypothetical protein
MFSIFLIRPFHTSFIGAGTQTGEAVMYLWKWILRLIIQKTYFESLVYSDDTGGLVDDQWYNIQWTKVR